MTHPPHHDDRHVTARTVHYGDTFDWETPVLVLASVGCCWAPPILGGVLLEHFDLSQPWRLMTLVLALGWVFFIGPAVLRSLVREQ